MAKDPAFLFYPNDYIGGTMGMSLEEKGAYMELLVLQFNKGAFTEVQAKKVLNGSFERLWPDLKEKFSEEGGKYFNERLQFERDKRKNFVSKQSERGKRGAEGRWKKDSVRYQKTDGVRHCLSNSNKENRNENSIDFGKSENLLKTELPKTVLEAAEYNQVTHTGKKNTEFLKSQWKVFLYERINDPPHKRKNRISELTEYYLNWIRNKFPTKQIKNGPTAEDIKAAKRKIESG